MLLVVYRILVQGFEIYRLQSAQLFTRVRENFKIYTYLETSRNTDTSPSTVAWTQVFK